MKRKKRNFSGIKKFFKPNKLKIILLTLFIIIPTILFLLIEPCNLDLGGRGEPYQCGSILSFFHGLFIMYLLIMSSPFVKLDVISFNIVRIIAHLFYSYTLACFINLLFRNLKNK